MRVILFLLNLLGLIISCSFFLFEFDLFGDAFYSLVSHFALGVFQFLISLILVAQRKKTNYLLDIHFAISCLYIVIAIIVRNYSSSVDEDFSLGVIPCFIALFFTIGFSKWVFSKPEESIIDTEIKTDE